MKRIITSLGLASMLVACSTYDPYTGDKKTSKATIGASIGAGITST